MTSGAWGLPCALWGVALWAADACSYAEVGLAAQCAVLWAFSPASVPLPDFCCPAADHATASVWLRAAATDPATVHSAASRAEPLRRGPPKDSSTWVPATSPEHQQRGKRDPPLVVWARDPAGAHCVESAGGFGYRVSASADRGSPMRQLPAPRGQECLLFCASS